MVYFMEQEKAITDAGLAIRQICTTLADLGFRREDPDLGRIQSSIPPQLVDDFNTPALKRAFVSSLKKVEKGTAPNINNPGLVLRINRTELEACDDNEEEKNDDDDLVMALGDDEVDPEVALDEFWDTSDDTYYVTIE